LLFLLWTAIWLSYNKTSIEQPSCYKAMAVLVYQTWPPAAILDFWEQIFHLSVVFENPMHIEPKRHVSI